MLSPDTLRQFPRIRMINWFEWHKPEPEIGGQMVDWTVTHSTSIARAFRRDLPVDCLRFAPLSLGQHAGADEGASGFPASHRPTDRSFERGSRGQRSTLVARRRSP